ncbi:ABC transporter permease [Emticicia sp. 21SJ11W-3]|uniref:ABC transporter permease n=1 Tax=Emticicia sp. 21SJ11W-3 TaxID=2916755 RepID=UPI00209EBF33|nr:ABC transporter permease [Emticicia sp. 21SJ11W-3]UTA67407.1 ABC transporter permease [Emticicia sp. 21SJ11W-3]
MIRNYLKIAWRNLVKSKVYSFINVFGLAVGMAVAILIGLWINDEMSANKHHANYATLYQVKMHQTFDGRRGTQDALPFPMGEELKSKYPDFKGVAMCDWGSTRSLLVGNQKFLKFGHFIGPDAMEMFSIQVTNGDKQPLKEPYSIVLTEETAEALFGKQDPVGKIVKVDNTMDLKVTAVVKKQPKNASLQYDYLIPFDLQEKIYDWVAKFHKTNWGNNSWQTFVQLKDGVDPEKTNARIKNVVLDHFKEDQLMQKSIKPEVFVHPMAKWRLYSDFTEGKNTGGFIRYVNLFGIFGIFVLVIACINFMNLSTARSEKRAKEVGVRKAVGSARNQLIGQFLSESILIAFISLVLAIVLVGLSLPYFNRMTEKQMSMELANPVFWAIMLAFTLITGLLAGSYPALYLSSFNPVKILKGGIHVGKNASLPRKILVVLQFTFSIVLMIGTVIIYQQIQYAKNRPIGFNSKGLISVESSSDLLRNYDALNNELLATGAVLSICKSNSPPTQIYSNNNGWEWKGSTPEDKSAIFSTIATSFNYVKTIGVKLKEGRDFSREYSTDSVGVLLNEAAVKRMGLKNPVGEILKWNGRERRVVGVVANVMMESPFRNISPLTIVFEKDWVSYINIRLNPTVSSAQAIKQIQPIFDKYNPGFPFDYKFADLEYAAKFNYEELIGNLAAIISVLAIFISCLGLFGLASFMAEQRKKEIGVRKVLGASVANLWGLLSKDFVKLIIISCVIASPIAWYGMSEWLSDYTYKIDIGVGVFLMVLFVAILVTLITVSYQAIKAALANPVKSLKTE